MRIAIVDDLVNERALLRNRLEQALNGRSVQTDICEYANGEAFIQGSRKSAFFRCLSGYLHAGRKRH